jgi:predicted O-linked N-acetylglucosamine transferase (SPINDLY family)
VTLVGPAFFERLSYSNLSNAGLGDLCTFTPDDYVRVAVALAGDRARRLALRHGLREQIRRLPLGMTDRFVEHLQRQIETVVASHRPA